MSVTRWDAADAEALAKLQASSPARPASWYGGLEIVRESNGYSFANLTPLYFVSQNLTDYSNWGVAMPRTRSFLNKTTLPWPRPRS